nr:hypothetical protein [Clostridia bacterium]
LVERDLAKVEVAGSSPVIRSNKKDTLKVVFFIGARCVPLARNVMCPSGVMFPSEAMYTAVRASGTHHITAHEVGSIAVRSTTSLRRSRYITENKQIYESPVRQ